MQDNRFAFGERVRHERRPEWGIGNVVKVQDLPGGAQRLSVRFAGAGVKTLSTEHAALVRISDAEIPVAAPADDEPSVANWHDLSDSDWMGPVAQKKIAEAMRRLPESTRDPFASVERRLEETLRLYRFEPSGRGLVDWAVAQTGLEDPLSRFNRHELESYFERWALERDAQLGRLLGEAVPDVVTRALRDAPVAAQRAVKRVHAVR